MALKLFALALAGMLVVPVAMADDEDVGAIEIASEPEGASVYIEGILAGTTPHDRGNLPEGKYRIVFKSSSNGGDFVQDVAVTKQQTTRVTATLASSGWRSPVREEDDWSAVVGKDSRKPYEKAKSTKKLGEYEILEIANFLVKSEEPLEPARSYAIFRDLACQLDDKTKFASFVTNYTPGVSERSIEADGKDAPTLVLSGVITEYQGGSQAKRYLVGFGAGKTRAYCLFRLVDKATGEVVFERMENGSVSMGMFGGSSSGAMKEIGADIAKAIRKNW